MLEMFQPLTIRFIILVSTPCVSSLRTWIDNPSDYHAHLVLFSMGHFQSFRNAKNKIKQLKKHTNNIVVVATKADAFQNFQVTDNDIAEMVKDFDLKSTVCLINSHAQFGSANSTYMIVEQLAEMLIA